MELHSPHFSRHEWVGTLAGLFFIILAAFYIEGTPVDERARVALILGGALVLFELVVRWVAGAKNQEKRALNLDTDDT